MSPTWTTFLFEVVNFLILAAVLGWLLFRPIRRVLDSRRAALAQEMEAAAAQRAEGERLQEHIKQRFAALDAELDRVRHDTLAAAQQEAERLRAEARAAAERERQAAQKQLTHMEEAQLEHIAAAVATAAGTAVERLLQQIGAPALERGLVQAACRALQGLDGEALQPVTVESAQPLDQEMQTALTSALGEAAQTMEFRLTPALGTGIRISTSRGLVDASATGLAAFAQRVLAEQLGHPQPDGSGAPTPTPEETPPHA